MELVKRFAKYYRPHIPLFTLDFSCAFALAGLELVFPAVVSLIIDEILPARDLRLLFYYAGGLFALYLLGCVLTYVVDFYGHLLGTKIEYDMRTDIFEHINKLSFSYFDNTKTGHLMSRITNDLMEITELAHHGPEDLFSASIMLIGSFFILIQKNVPLTLAIFAIVPVMLWFAIRKNKHMRRTFQELRARVADINAQLEDSISGVRVAKAFGNEGHEQSKFERGNMAFQTSRVGSYRVMAEFFTGIKFFMFLINIVVISLGGLYVYRGTLSVGDFVAFFLYVGMFLQPVRRITALMEGYQRGMAGFRRFLEVMDTHPDISDHPDADELATVVGRITFDNVTFSYNDNQNVLKNLSFSVLPGETVAVVGPSGGGKTTLCSLIPRFYEVQDGSILVDDYDIRKVTQKSLRQHIGIVQQDVFLFNETVKENIAYGRIGAKEEDIIAAARKANAHEFIMGLENGYDTFIGERGVKLSGGQKQRLAIARMFLKNPPILILDEATSALDNETEQVIQESLFDLAENRTTLIIAHRLATIRRADRIMVLTDEGIVEEGNHVDLLKRGGIYARLYNAQFKDLPLTTNLVAGGTVF